METTYFVGDDHRMHIKPSARIEPKLVTTGHIIHQEISRLQTELAQINEALTQVTTGTLPYKLLCEIRDNKRKELKNAQEARYVVSDDQELIR